MAFSALIRRTCFSFQNFSFFSSVFNEEDRRGDISYISGSCLCCYSNCCCCCWWCSCCCFCQCSCCFSSQSCCCCYSYFCPGLLCLASACDLVAAFGGLASLIPFYVGNPAGGMGFRPLIPFCNIRSVTETLGGFCECPCHCCFPAAVGWVYGDSLFPGQDFEIYFAAQQDQKRSRRHSTTTQISRPPQVSTLGMSINFFQLNVTITSKSPVAMLILLLTDETSIYLAKKTPRSPQ